MTDEPQLTQDQIVAEFNRLCMSLGELEARYRIDKSALLNRIHELNQAAVKLQQAQAQEPTSNQEETK